ncbi:GNAT family N-acetyltransferase [Mycoplasmoides alvi]|uniref:GNAT family N-acetyltransferase n=1 Tax=Mycoplasmoides alvi TaxID=78580 RepID=UPI00051BA742|nr:GNAT family protein [Mycoplasmoides alvi]
MFKSNYQVNQFISLSKIDISYTSEITKLRKINKLHLPFLTWINNQEFTDNETLLYIKEKLWKWSKNEEWTFAIFYKTKIIGDFQIRKRINPVEIEIGYWLDYHYRLKGIMTNIINYISHISKSLGFQKIVIITDKANVASINLALKLNFIKDNHTSHQYSDKSLLVFTKNI